MSAAVLDRPGREAEKDRHLVPTPTDEIRRYPSVAAQRLAGVEAALAAGDVALAERLLQQALSDMAAEDRAAAPPPRRLRACRHALACEVLTRLPWTRWSSLAVDHALEALEGLR